jgi:hypothetical protein
MVGCQSLYTTTTVALAAGSSKWFLEDEAGESPLFFENYLATTMHGVGFFKPAL